MTTNPHSNQKLTLRDLLKRIAPPLVVYRASLIPAIASEFTCSRRTVLRKLKEGFRHQFIRGSKNGRLVLTQKGIAFYRRTAPIFPSTRFEAMNRGAVKGGRIDGLGACGCGTCESFETPVTDCRWPLSLDSDTPPIRGVVCRRHVGLPVEQVQNDCQGTITTLYHSFWPVVSKMPRLSNWPDRNLPFDYARSEVIRFVMHHCGIGLAMAIGIFYLAIHRGVVAFDAASMTWAGAKGGCR
jgi:hypothetical protein